MMSIGNQKFGIPRKYQRNISIWCLLLNHLVKIWLNIGFFGRIKWVWYLVSLVVISLVSVWFQFVIFLKMTSL